MHYLQTDAAPLKFYEKKLAELQLLVMNPEPGSVLEDDDFAVRAAVHSTDLGYAIALLQTDLPLGRHHPALRRPAHAHRIRHRDGGRRCSMSARIITAREAMLVGFKAEAARLGATVHSDGGTLVASWPEAARQTTSVTLSAARERLALTETAMLRVPEGPPDELLERFGHRAAVVGRLRAHLGMVERVTGVPLLAPRSR